MHKWRTIRRTRRTHSYVRDCTCTVAQLACVCMMVADSTETYMKKHTSVRQRTQQCSPFVLTKQCKGSAPSDRERIWRNACPTLRVHGLGINPQRTCTLMWVERRNTELEGLPIGTRITRKTTPSCRLGGSTKQKPCKTDAGDNQVNRVAWYCKESKTHRTQDNSMCHSAHDTHL